ncbi:unnamed protein product [Trichogramma brassicae]|uniref:Retrotransposon gag domain-containing protein n=1 Tax=Trichogramma brassicae TaxID=86971 RepID=A0A6H5J3B1_9HYME|nr:unnamed protein product [Trichogramma brassicae]
MIYLIMKRIWEILKLYLLKIKKNASIAFSSRIFQHTRLDDFINDVKTKFCGAGETEKYKMQLRSIIQGIKEPVSDYGLRVQFVLGQI